MDEAKEIDKNERAWGELVRSDFGSDGVKGFGRKGMFEGPESISYSKTKVH